MRPRPPRRTGIRTALVALVALAVALAVAAAGALCLGPSTATARTTAAVTTAPTPPSTTIDDSGMDVGLRYFRIRRVSGERYRVVWATNNVRTIEVTLVRRDGVVVRRVLTSHASSGRFALTVRHPRLRRLRVDLFSPDTQVRKMFRLLTG